MEPKLMNVPKKYCSKVWEHFGFRSTADKDKEKSTCKLCSTDVSYKAGTTSNMKKHLKRRHNIGDLDEKTTTQTSPVQLVKSGTQIQGQPKLTECIINKLAFSNKRRITITKAVGGFICSDLRPYSTVSGAGFRHMLNVLEPRYQIPSRNYFSNTIIPELYNTVMDRVKTRLKQTSSIAITTDALTSPATENYVTITRYFVNDDWEVENYTLQPRKFSASHTGVNLGNDLKETVEAWELERSGRGPAVTTDNAANIVCGMREAGLSPHMGCLLTLPTFLLKRDLIYQRLTDYSDE
ncbi:E3 SUMO-protein ligase ZBED1-like [Argopecten irradians]|uniref:E3 SUMO-protein ligase ZBED1-like n=1 Tax=Argopecten irradians TaxID=31199 RepID=UPI003719873E